MVTHNDTKPSVCRDVPIAHQTRVVYADNNLATGHDHHRGGLRPPKLRACSMSRHDCCVAVRQFKYRENGDWYVADRWLLPAVY
jgi:hypothetical protein